MSPPTLDGINVPALRVEVVYPTVLTVSTFDYRRGALHQRTRLARDGSYRIPASLSHWDFEASAESRARPQRN